MAFMWIKATLVGDWYLGLKYRQGNAIGGTRWRCGKYSWLPGAVVFWSERVYVNQISQERGGRARRKRKRRGRRTQQRREAGGGSWAAIWAGGSKANSPRCRLSFFLSLSLSVSPLRSGPRASVRGFCGKRRKWRIEVGRRDN